MSETEGCASGKTSYRSRKAALKVLNNQRRSIAKYGEHGPHMAGGARTAYRCEVCGDWHLTKNANSKSRRRAS